MRVNSFGPFIKIKYKQNATIGEQQDTIIKNRVGRKEKRRTKTEQREAIGGQKTAYFEQGTASHKKQGYIATSML